MVTVRTFFVDATWKGDTSLSGEVLEYLAAQGYSSIGLFASVQFLNVDKVKKQLKDAGVNVLITKAKRTNAPLQILGCDAYHDSFESPIIEEADALLYIGDGLFHPNALLFAQRGMKEQKECILWNPIEQKMTVIAKKDVCANLKRLKGNILMFLSAKVIGILVTIKPGQEYLRDAFKLKEKVEAEGKKAYIFVDDTIALDKLENYPFVEVWVNTACPRIGLDDITSIRKPLLNSREALDPSKALEHLE